LPITAVFDTNILFSATGWRENPFHCVERARAGKFPVFTCPELMEELGEKLGTRLHFSADQVAETLADYLGFLQVIQIPTPDLKSGGVSTCLFHIFDETTFSV
jgi:uncharacterized protein